MLFEILPFLTFFAIAAADDAGNFAALFFSGKQLSMGRADPIVSPGDKLFGHVHHFQGSNGIVDGSINIDAATCTTSNVVADKSIYWTPSLFFRHDNGTLESVNMYYMKIYYFFNNRPAIKPFPKGLRMIAGDMSLRTPPSSAALNNDHKNGPIQPVQWTCPRSTQTGGATWPTNSDGLHGAGIAAPGSTGDGVGFPQVDCDGAYSPLRANIRFPSCYNPAVDPTNYKGKNMDYPTNGVCPTGWIQTPELNYEVYHDTAPFAKLWTPGQGKSPWVLSTGDPTGYGIHGDFVNGWDEDVLTQLATTCTRTPADESMTGCQGLKSATQTTSTCNIDMQQMYDTTEQWTGTMNLLPGGIPVGQWGVAAAANTTMSTASTSATTAASTSATGSAAASTSATGNTAAITSVSTSAAAAGTTGKSTLTSSPTLAATDPVTSTVPTTSSSGNTVVTTPLSGGAGTTTTTTKKSCKVRA